MNAEGGKMKAEGGRRSPKGGSSSCLVSPSSFILHPSSLSRLLHPSSFILVLASLLLASCGFQLRGTATLPFDTLFVQAPITSQFANQLKRAVSTGSQTRVVDRPAEAQVLLHILNEAREKQVLSLSGGGRVREFLLRYRVSYRVTDNKSAREFIGTTEIVLQRDFSYNDNEALAKEAEEALLYRDMQTDAVQQLVRRLQLTKLAT
jgi:LPS-assembly lipoprotein